MLTPPTSRRWNTKIWVPAESWSTGSGEEVRRCGSQKCEGSRKMGSLGSFLLTMEPSCWRCLSAASSNIPEKQCLSPSPSLQGYLNPLCKATGVSAGLPVIDHLLRAAALCQAWDKRCSALSMLLKQLFLRPRTPPSVPVSMQHYPGQLAQQPMYIARSPV